MSRPLFPTALNLLLPSLLMPKPPRSFINQIICGDARQVLAQLPDESIDCVVTSPPYWALRDYGVKNQIGLEATIEEYIETLCSVFDEVKRVLKPKGTCWVNLGDTYSMQSKAKGRWSPSPKSKRSKGVITSAMMRPYTKLPRKCLLQIPARFAIGMIDRGWILRNEIIWHKPNAMPESVRDRFTVDFEKIFFFVKQKNYWFDLDSVREPHSADKKAEAIKSAKKMGYSGKGSYKEWYFNQRAKIDWLGGKRSLAMGRLASRGVPTTRLMHPLGKGKRCVWSIHTRPFPGNHFAVYPPELIETPIKAGCPKGGIVLDPFIGSGTTALVAKKLDRKFIGIDLNPRYVRMARATLGSDPFRKGR